MDQIAVAASPFVGRALARLQDSGALPAPVWLVEIGDDGRVADGAGVRVLWRRGIVPPEWIPNALDSLPDLAWFHSDFVGIDTIPVERLAERGIVLSNGAGNFTEPMAEWALLGMLLAAKQLPELVRKSDSGRWEPHGKLRELGGKVALIIGLGSVGTQVARLAAPFGIEVRAAVRRPRGELPPGVAKVVVGEAWRAELPEADFIVLCLPLTSATTNMLDAKALAACRPDAYVINLARGGLIDDDAMLEALDEGRIGGAVLDAFVEEPLPPDHPYWRRPNVLVVPHSTWAGDHVRERQERLFADQLTRFTKGEPLENVIDPDTGY